MSLANQLITLEARIKGLEDSMVVTTDSANSASINIAALKEAVDKQIAGTVEAAKNEALVGSRLAVEKAIVELRQAIQESVVAQVHSFVNQRIDSLRNELLEKIAKGGKTAATSKQATTDA